MSITTTARHQRSMVTLMAVLLCTALILSTFTTITMVSADHCRESLEPLTFDRILVINFENRGYLQTMLQPYFRKVARELGAVLSKYYAITHPSQPNYLTQIAGDYWGEKTDKNVDLPYTTVVDQLERAGVTWKSYQENYPPRPEEGGDSEGWNEHGCYIKSKSPDRLYVRKHNPFLSFTNITGNRTRCSKIVNSDQLYEDIRTGQLPQLMYYTPNLDNDGHDTNLKHANRWLEGFLQPLLENQRFMNGTLVFITFDEDLLFEFNHVYAAVVGPMVVRGHKDKTKYTHYSLLRTIQDNWRLGQLGRNDDKAVSFRCLKKENKYKPYVP